MPLLRPGSQPLLLHPGAQGTPSPQPATHPNPPPPERGAGVTHAAPGAPYPSHSPSSCISPPSRAASANKPPGLRGRPGPCMTAGGTTRGPRGRSGAAMGGGGGRSPREPAGMGRGGRTHLPPRGPGRTRRRLPRVGCAARPLPAARGGRGGAGAERGWPAAEPPGALCTRHGDGGTSGRADRQPSSVSASGSLRTRKSHSPGPPHPHTRHPADYRAPPPSGDPDPDSSGGSGLLTGKRSCESLPG